MIHDSANEWQKKHKGLHHDVERLDIGKAPEDSRDHLDIIAGSTTKLQSQDLHTWFHGAWGGICASLQLQFQCTRLLREKRPHIYLIIDHSGMTSKWRI
jgi:hypothetical protein